MSAIAGHYSYWITVMLMVTGMYILVARGNLLKKLLGLAVLQSSVYLLYIAPGKLIGGTAPIIAEGYALYSNPLPHVLILTAIVVGIGRAPLDWRCSTSSVPPSMSSAITSIFSATMIPRICASASRVPRSGTVTALL